MGFHVVITETSRGFSRVESDCVCCAERRLIKTLKRECFKRGNRIFKFSNWVRRKFGTLIISRPTSYGDGKSLPCVLCRKMIEKYDLKWKAFDGEKWIESKYPFQLPKSQPTHKQRRELGFGFNNDS